MIRTVFLLLSLLCAGIAAQAQQFPALYDVTGVAADDVLNIRAEPDAGAAIVGSLAANATGVEVLGQDASGRWVRVGTGETSGWAALRYLRPLAAGGVFPDVPALRCAGTEPFWSLYAPRGRTARFQLFDNPAQDYPSAAWQGATGRGDRILLDLGVGTAAVVRQTTCSDGMSDRDYGLEIDLITGLGARPQLHSGCCSIAAQ